MFGANGFGQAYYGQIAATSGISASATVAFSATAALRAPVPLAASAAIRLSTTATFASAAFASTAQISVLVGAWLTVVPRFGASATIQLSTVATFAAPRFTTLPHLHVETTATLSVGVDHSTEVGILLAGAEARTRIAGLTIRDVLNDAPNTCSLVIDGTETPQCEQALRVTLGVVLVSSPPAAPALALAAGGAMNVGTYRYCYAYHAAGAAAFAGLSLPSPVATITTTPGQQSVTLTIPAPPAVGIDYVYIYRTGVNGTDFQYTTYATAPGTRTDPTADSARFPQYLPPLTDTAGLRDKSGNVLLFNGALQTVNLSYEGLPEQIAYPCAAIDDTARANRMRPFGTWTNISATTVAQQLIAQFAPGFTTAHVQPNLPPVSIILDGTEGMSGALTQITTQIGGYYYFEDTDLHLFIEEITAAPDPIDGTPGRLLDDPPITISRDDSQLRTRQCGRGHGETLLADVAAGETILPIANVLAWFNQVNSGRRAIALSERLTYAGTQPGGGGSLVGPGASPVVAPSATAVPGAGLPTGVLKYAVTFVTPSGESLVGPLTSITAGPVTGAPIPDPTTAPSGSPSAGVGLSLGSRQYAFTFYNAGGETVNGPLTTVTIQPAPAPTAPPTWSGNASTGGGLVGGSYPANQWCWAVTFVSASGETGYGPRTNIGNFNPGTRMCLIDFGIPFGPPGTIARRLYRTVAQPDTAHALSAPLGLEQTINDNTTPSVLAGVIDDSALGGGASPNAVANGVVNLAGIAPGPAGTVGRKVYRTAANGSTLQLLTTLADNGTTTFTDTIPDGSLGPAAPGSNTTALTTNMNAATVTGIPLGPGTVTARKLYRTAVNGAALFLRATIADNTTTVLAGGDAVPDASLGAAAPISDTSGLIGIGVAGSVLPGTTTLLTSGAGPFAVAGGWALLSGNQLVRYTGITGNTLTGIPASGVGALVTTVLYGTQVMPAPTLIGVAGLTIPLPKGTPICIWVQRDDLGAQAEQKAVDTANGIVPADGIYEGPPLVDERRNEASMAALCDANLAQYARPIVSVTYACRDVKTKSGKTIVIDLDSPAIHEELTIQEVTITEIDIAPGLLPRFSVTASSVRFSLDDILRRLLTATDATP